MRLVSYNCQALTRGLAGVAETLSRLVPDVAALQEIDRLTRRSGGRGAPPGPPVDQLAALAAALGPPYQGVFVPAMPYDGGEYGLAVLARGAVEALGRLALPRHGQEEPRIAMLVRVALPGGQDLALVNTHLAADLQAERPAALRLSQATALAAWLTELRGQLRGPLFLCGDCNSEPGSPPIEALCQVARPLHPALLTYPSHAPAEAIDHAFVVPEPRSGAPQAEAAWVDPSQASDHRPLVIDMQ